MTTEGRGQLGVTHGAALYVGSLVGPGVLLVPALAVQAAGPASVLAWAALLLLSAPLAYTFAALGVRMPVAGGVAEYVRAGFGPRAGLITGGWFLTAVIVGAPAVSLIGGFYVADLTGSGIGVAALVGLAILGTVLVANVLGLRISSRLQLVTAGSPDAADLGGDRRGAAVARRGELAPVRAPRLARGRHRCEHPRLAVRRLGGRRAAGRRLPRSAAPAAAIDGVRLRDRHRALRRTGGGHRRGDVRLALEGAARRPDGGRVRRDGTPGDDRARGRADDGHDERLHRRRVEARRGARASRARCRAGSRATRGGACRAGRCS